jgi:hypothetical protein
LRLACAALGSSGSISRCQGAVAFFHPFTNDGGGGERVLWCACALRLSLLRFRLCLRVAPSDALRSRARCAVRAIQAAAPHVQARCPLSLHALHACATLAP